MEQYRINSLSVDQLDRIELPKFQRGFVWTDSKKNDFVQTLHDGYPFGTLLVYPQSNETNAKLQLLDGQQRLSTIKQYVDNPLKFWKPLNYDEYKQALDQANSGLSENECFNELQFDDLINSDENTIINSLLVQYDLDKNKALNVVNTIHRIKTDIINYVDINNLKIPMIEYLGDEEHLADVFANLNKGGMPLSKYEVFNASWVKATLQLAPANESELQDEILQYVKQFYIDMQNQAEFELQNFSEDELSRIRVITLAEFGLALGRYIVNHLQSLVPDSSSAAQEMGFGLLGIIVGLDNKKLNELNGNRHLAYFQSNMEVILQKTKIICGNLNSLFLTLLRRSKKGGFGYEIGLSTSFKTLSYFAAL